MGSWWSRLPAGENCSTNSSSPDGIRQISDSVYSLSEPEGAPEIEIIFVHGLQLSDYKQAHGKGWIAGVRDNDGNEVCWPMTWLKEDFPGARMLSLSYDSPVLCTNETGYSMDIFTVGESLVQEMVDIANIGQQKNCPVVFICYSLGGLVVKDIVIKAQGKFGDNAKYANFLQNIRGFHFYSTPHDGLKLADLASHGPYREDKSKMVDQLRLINEGVNGLNAEFERIESDHFAEAHPTSYYEFNAMVVEMACARYKYRRILFVTSDHFGVCKPNVKVSSSYEAVRHFIKEVFMSEQPLT